MDSGYKNTDCGLNVPYCGLGIKLFFYGCIPVLPVFILENPAYGSVLRGKSPNYTTVTLDDYLGLPDNRSLVGTVDQC